MTTRAAAVLAVLVAAGCLAACSAISEPYGSRSPGATLGPVVNGTATSFGGPQDLHNPYTPSGGLVNGACGYGALAADEWPYWNVAGISPNNSLAASAGPAAQGAMPMAGCGKCIQVVCADGDPNCPADAEPVVVQVVDSCPKCTPTQLNLPYLVFSRSIANGDLGNVSVQWQQVECQPPGPIVATINSYRASASGFLALTLNDIAGTGALTSVELRSTPQSGSAMTEALTLGWQQMSLTYGAVWELSGLPPLPWDLRITNAAISEQLLAQGVITAPVQPGKEYATQAQFSTTTSPVFTGEPGSTLQQQPNPVAAETTAASGGPGGGDLAEGTQPQPANCTQTVYQLLKARPDTSSFLAAAATTGLTPALQNPNATYTVLVPTNVAFANLTASDTSVNMSDPDTLRLVLLYHFIPGQLRSTDVCAQHGGPILPEDMVNGSPSIQADTVNGLRLRVASSAPGKLQFIGAHSNATAVAADLPTCAAIVDIISAVLLP